MTKLFYIIIIINMIVVNVQINCFGQSLSNEASIEKSVKEFKVSTESTKPINVDIESGGMVEKENSENDMIWGVRLAPHGNPKIAANAIVNYVKNYHMPKSSYSPNWNCIGPIGDSKHIDMGQITRITFDPNYGLSNNIVYAASTYGGLWRSEDSGDNWALVNTDLLPVTNVADIAVDAQDNDNLFIALGLCDGTYPNGWGCNTGYINPLFTGGIWRSLNYGQSWESISDNFLLDFIDGGTIRRIICDPTDANNLFVATTWGIYSTSNVTNLYHILNDLRKSSCSTVNLSESQTTELNKINEKCHNRIGAYARNLLIACKKINYIEPIVLPEFPESTRVSDQSENEIRISGGKIKTYPNPANNYFIIDYRLLSTSGSSAILKFYDPYGKMICTRGLTLDKNQITIDTEQWSTGLYLLTLELDGSVVESSKICIIR